MRFPGLTVACTALALIGGAVPVAGQVTVTGVVREDGTQRSLPGVAVLIEGTKREVTTDHAGRYRLDAPAGNRVALFRAIGLRPYRLRLHLIKGDSVTADVVMVREQAAQQLDPVVTTAHPTAPRGIGVEAFEERRRLGFGKFIDSTELRRAEHRRLTDLLRGIPGIRVVSFVENTNRPWDFEWRVAGRKASVDGSPCWMSVILDGAPIFRSGSLSPPPDFRRGFFEVASLQAVEVYRSAAEVPLEYGGPGEQCGLLLLWTRRPK